MGRYYWSKKDTVEDCTKLSIVKLKEFGLLEGFCHTTLTWTRSLSGHKSSIGIVVDVMDEPYYVKLNYTITARDSGEKTDYDYKIGLTTTPCHFGGVRYWFICPLSRNGMPCGRRIGTLFLSSGSKCFDCRHCYDLSYESRNECRLGQFGQIGYALKADRQVEELREKIKRWTYRGRPTRKAKKLHILEQKMNWAVSLSGVIGKEIY
jgi:hypothetical protein